MSGLATEPDTAALSIKVLPHLAGRPGTFIRSPDGVGGEQFFEKNVPHGAPSWLPTVRIARSGSRGSTEPITYALLDELAAVVWAANMAALELHVPQWTVDTAGIRQPPDLLVFDLDPGPDTSIVQCCRVAERLHDALIEDGLTPLAKTSGSKGLQLYCAITTEDPAAPSAYAKKLAQRFARETPDEVTAVMTKAQRIGRVFIDWSQNNPAKTTVAPYTLRGRGHPTVSTPITWDEVRACRQPAQLVFTAGGSVHDVGPVALPRTPPSILMARVLDPPCARDRQRRDVGSHVGRASFDQSSFESRGGDDA